MMDEEMIEAMAKALWELEHGTEGKWPINVENPDDWYAQARAAHSVIAGQIAELEGALRPFSQKADAIERRDKVWRRARSADGYTVAIRLGDCRKARAALAQTKGTDR